MEHADQHVLAVIMLIQHLQDASHVCSLAVNVTVAPIVLLVPLLSILVEILVSDSALQVNTSILR